AEMEPARALAVARYGGRGVTSPAAYAWLVARLQSPDGRLREAAAFLFGRSRDVDGWRAHAPAIRTAFMALRGDPARMHLALALGRLRDPNDLPRLAQAMLDDPDWRNRVNIARAYAPFAVGSPTNSEPLVMALDDANDHVARTAADALAADATLPGAMAVTFAAWVESHPRRPLVAGSLLPALARMGRADVVMAWLDRTLRRDDPAAPYHAALALTALGNATDDASLARLTAEAGQADVVRAGPAVEALKARWGGVRTTADAATTRRYYDQFAAALRRRDLATTTAAAPIMADSLFGPYNPGVLLRETYAQMEAPRDIEPMVEMVRAAGQIRDGGEVEFLMGVALAGHPVLRDVAADALDERLIEGIDVDTTGRVPPTTVLIEWDYARRLGPRPLLVLETRLGRVVIEMDTEGAPQTVMKLAKTAVLGHFNGVPFHRVVPNFVVQGGDYFRRDGYGGPDVNLRSEFTRQRYGTGTVGMASAGKDTEGVQYFVTHSPTPHLDGRYTAFGRVVAGQDVADALQPGDVVTRARIVRTSER
ncbi:MAG TPA: peptidylprolyl isomerase, partial [Rhodothermales bacterium]|nr:peptidylprolyl isomerase [Rhodothermales bacterium]